MSRYVIESGLSEHGRNPMWVVVERGHSDPDVAYEAMVNRAQFMRVQYEPHGGRKLRVREVKP